MSIILEEHEVVTIHLHQIAILKHPGAYFTPNEFVEYQKLHSSYVTHQIKPRLHIKRIYLWNRQHAPVESLQNLSQGSITSEEGINMDEDSFQSAVEEQDTNNDLNRETNVVQSREEVGIPEVRTEIVLEWESEDDQSMQAVNYRSKEEKIKSPMIFKLDDFVKNDITEDTHGGCAFQVIYTDNVAQLSFRHPLKGPQYSFRKIRLSFQTNMELQDFLYRIDTLIRIRRCRETDPPLTLLSNREKKKLGQLNANPIAHRTRNAKRTR